MARIVLDGWIPVEKSSGVIQAIGRQSAVEALARPEPMASDTKEVPRSGGADVAVTPKGGTYAETDNTDSVVTLRARKFTSAFRLAEEDLADAPADVIRAKARDWATAYARVLDNAALGVNAAENGTTVPFTSVYRTLATADAGLGYTAGANIVSTAAGTAPTFAQVSSVLGLVENGDYFGDLVVIAHPLFLGTFRTMVDGGGNLVFQQGGAENVPDRLFGLPVRWSSGARTSTVNTGAPGGNPLLVVANRDMLILGKRSGPETKVISADVSLTDEAVLKCRSRRGFALGHPNGAAILEAVRTAGTAGT